MSSLLLDNPREECKILEYRARSVFFLGVFMPGFSRKRESDCSQSKSTSASSLFFAFVLTTQFFNWKRPMPFVEVTEYDCTAKREIVATMMISNASEKPSVIVGNVEITTIYVSCFGLNKVDFLRLLSA